MSPRSRGSSALQPNDQPFSRPSARGFALTGPSSPPDPTTHAYRKDLADIALAGVVIASHYAAPAPRRLVQAGILFETASETSAIAELARGDSFQLLDDSLGWAWGYAGAGRRVGYVRSECLAP